MHMSLHKARPNVIQHPEDGIYRRTTSFLLPQPPAGLVLAAVWCSPVPAPSTDTRADPASARRAAGAARGRVGRAGGPLWCGPSLGAWGLFRPERLPDHSRLIAHNCSNNRPRTSLLLRAARVLATPASTAEGPRFPRRQGRRVTGRPSPPRSSEVSRLA